MIATQRVPTTSSGYSQGFMSHRPTAFNVNAPALGHALRQFKQLEHSGEVMSLALATSILLDVYYDRFNEEPEHEIFQAHKRTIEVCRKAKVSAKNMFAQFRE